MEKLKKNFAIALGMMAFLFVQNISYAQNNMAEFVAKWENGKQFTLEVVDKMPDNLLAYKPHETAMSFTEQIVHLSAAMAGMSQRFLNGDKPSFDLSAKPTSKAELKAFVANCYDYVKATASKLSDAQMGETVDVFGTSATRRQALALIDDHTTHHRGAAISYIRSNGIEPPRFRAM
ncbi:Uncharacterized damage-inducible protein DinB (forms a four-helix bundle) [Aquiflexum balticum DSM 16537]|uniref:Uncharacterized damage-inducible protein DinB (Forms a four-helix bundle) n=1 Tax=Aquiflexum balticum DSM 16537 TaxID=758820 RepID=A0A1W2H0K9_9BACT|nr:DinB family protein [Aquiflexum balticum]SMD42168.1 Uncharacterized damage-inducible protein DinB (forms a four-helix bundle) [Aquiflexum balticum DSM 16537]